MTRTHRISLEAKADHRKINLLYKQYANLHYLNTNDFYISREQIYVTVRFAIYYYFYTEHKVSKKRIANGLNQDPTTITHGIDMYSQYLGYDNKIIAQYKQVKSDMDKLIKENLITFKPSKSNVIDRGDENQKRLKEYFNNIIIRELEPEHIKMLNTFFEKLGNRNETT